MKKNFLALCLLISLTSLLAQNNITNTLGTGGLFSIKDATNTFFTLTQSNGNVGIGTTTPSIKLQVYGTETGANWAGMGAFGGASNAVVLGQYNDKAYLGAHNAALDAWSDLAINPEGGNVGIGTTTPGYKLHVESNVSNSYVAVIRNNNNTSGGYGLQVLGGGGSDEGGYGAYLIDFSDVTGATQLGSITQTGSNTVAYNTSSDRRLKNNIVNTHFGISDLMKIQVRDYIYKADASKTLVTGFIAQELYEIFPNAVTKPAKEEDMWSMDYGKVTPLLVKAIQEQQELIQSLKNELQDIKNELNSLKKVKSER